MMTYQEARAEALEKKARRRKHKKGLGNAASMTTEELQYRALGKSLRKQGFEKAKSFGLI